MPVTRAPDGSLQFTPNAAPLVPEPSPVPQQAVDMAQPPEIPQIMTAEDGTGVQELPDGSVLIDVELGGEANDNKDESFDANLALDLGDTQLSALCTDLLDGIESDISSRRQLVETYSKGLDLLGTKIEDRANKQTRKSVSTIRHPILLESVVTFQSSALGELLPADGPVKVEVIGGDSQQSTDTANDLEEDFNAYLTTGAPEYYPDMDRGLFNLGYGGTIFKKIYRCPLRKRPVSECITLIDLIVSEDATNLDGAIRVTHRIKMNPADVKRMQIGGVWRDVALQAPPPMPNPVDSKQKTLAGLTPNYARPKDTPYEIYECYTDLNPADYGLPQDGAEDGLYLPYRVTIEQYSRQILEIRRNWREGDEQYKKRQRFVMYGLVPGFGFLCLGFLHLLGNQTRAMTAAWRIMMDGGMFSNFPGGVRVKGTRQTTNEINPGPGEWPEIDTGPMDDIRKALMPLPYKDVSPVFMQFVELVNKNVQGISGAVELQSGEGRTNVPVGTIMAMIEQQTKVMAAVHKRMHHSQAQEFCLLKELFEEDPESLTKWAKNPARKWTREQLEQYELIPASDPAVPSQTHRIMLATALVTIASGNPDIYDKYKVHKRALKAVGINDADDFLHPAPPPMPPPPPAPAAAASPQMLAIKQEELAQKKEQQQREAAQGVLHAKQEAQKDATEAQLERETNESRERVAMIEQETERMRLASENQHRNLDRQTDHFHKTADRTQEDLHQALDSARENQAQGRSFGGKEF
jgi:hypothetical protein